MDVEKRIKKVLEVRPARDREKLKKHQNYFKKLTAKGLVQKQQYNIRTLSAV